MTNSSHRAVEGKKNTIAKVICTGPGPGRSGPWAIRKSFLEKVISETEAELFGTSRSPQKRESKVDWP